MVINDDDVDDDDDSKSHVCVSDAELFHTAHKLVDLYATSAVCVCDAELLGRLRKVDLIILEGKNVCPSVRPSVRTSVRPQKVSSI